jgi:cytochrome c556
VEDEDAGLHTLTICRRGRECADVNLSCDENHRAEEILDANLQRVEQALDAAMNGGGNICFRHDGQACFPVSSVFQAKEANNGEESLSLASLWRDSSILEADAKAAAAARDLGATTKKIPELFPEGSNGHPSEALDAVWKEWGRFKGDAHDAEAAANALAAALEASVQDWKASFQKMTDACKSCHESFRAKEEESSHH